MILDKGPIIPFRWHMWTSVQLQFVQAALCITINILGLHSVLKHRDNSIFGKTRQPFFLLICIFYRDQPSFIFLKKKDNNGNKHIQKNSSFARNSYLNNPRLYPPKKLKNIWICRLWAPQTLNSPTISWLNKGYCQRRKDRLRLAVLAWLLDFI